ncbi:unnamed protein product [Lota lota]
MSSVKDLSLVYDLPNAKGGFSEGDKIKGTFTFELKNDTKVQSIFIKAKGDANVSWKDESEDASRSLTAHERFFKVKVYVTPQNSKETVILKGIHRHNFLVAIPQTNLPSSFKGDNGKIVYTLEAKITRRFRMDCKVQTEFNLFSRSSYNIYHLMPQVGIVEKDVGAFSKGQVQLSANMERGVYASGETLVVIANVKNSSSKEIKPKYTLKQVVVTRFKQNINSSTKILFRASGDVIEPETQKRVICSMQIPADMAQSIGNCKILSVEYFLKVYLDIKFCFDPEITFPLVIVPPGSIDFRQSVGAAGLYPTGATVGHLYPSPSTFPTPFPAGPSHLPQEMPPYAAFPGQAAYPPPQQIHPFPVADPYALPQSASMNSPHFQELPPPYEYFPT